MGKAAKRPQEFEGWERGEKETQFCGVASAHELVAVYGAGLLPLRSMLVGGHLWPQTAPL